MNVKVVSIALFFLPFVCFSQSQEELVDYFKSENPRMGSVLDSLINDGVDSIIVYGRVKNNIDELHVDTNYFQFFYYDNGIKGLFKAVSYEGRNGKLNRLSLEKKKAGLRAFNEIVVNKGDSLLSELKENNIESHINKGVFHMFYFKFGDKEVVNGFCCRFHVNDQMWEKKRTLWMLISAFNNE